jgi:flagellin
MRVNHNIASMTALRHLGNTNQATERNLQRLSSGMRINSGADGPAELMISEQMRAQVTGLNQAVKNSETGISMVQTAEGALNEVSSILINMRQLTLHAANEGANDEKMLQADQNEMENLLSTLDRIAKNTQFGTRTLFDGSNSANGVVVGDGLSFIGASEITKAPPTKSGYEIDIKQVATRSEVIADRGITIEDMEEGVTFVINEGNRLARLNTNSDDPEMAESVTQIMENYRKSPDIFDKNEVENNIRDIVARSLDKKAKENGLKVDVFIDEMGMLNVRHQMFGSEPSFSVTSSKAGVLAKEANVATYSDGGRDVAGYIGGEVGVGQGQMLHGAVGTPVEGLVVQYDKVLEKRVIDIKDVQGNVVGQQLVQQSNDELVGPNVDGYVHISQNSLTYQVGANYQQTVKFSLADLRSEQLAQGTENDSGYRSLADVDLTTGAGAQDALLMVDRAIEEINVLRANLGSFQKNALETNLRNLRVASEKLTSAESVIRDSDMAQEMSEFTKNQILLASGTAMAAQANQIPKSVLQLLNGAQ